MAQQPVILNIPPGIRRDGAYIEGDLTCTDGRWVRFDRDRPRKMGGYRKLISLANGPAQSLWVSDKDAGPGIYLGRSGGIDYVRLQGTTPFPPIDRSPSGFTDDPRVLWQFDQLYSSTSSASVVLAHPGLNLADIANSENSPLYFAIDDDLTDFALLNPNDGTDDLTGVSGGVVVLHPYAMYYGNDGFLTWSAPNEPANLATADGGGGTAGVRIAASKIVRGLPYRGGPGNAPAGLFWSLSSLSRLAFVGGAPVFSSDVISDQTTILSSSSPIEYDGQFYWVGTDRFYMFNGVVRELKNMMNLDFFFDNLNRTYAQKVYSFKIPRRGEIWFCFPKGDSTFCNHAVIFNVRNNSWYDTDLPLYGRGSGSAAQVLGFPYLAAAVSSSTSTVTPATEGTFIGVGGSGFQAAIMRCVDGGATWADVTDGGAAANRYSGVASDGDVWIVVGFDEIWRSTDDGLTWNTIVPPDTGVNFKNVVSPESGVFVINASPSESRIFQSTDAGLTFSEITHGLTGSLSGAATNGTGTVIVTRLNDAGSDSVALGVSTDSGVTWANVDEFNGYAFAMFISFAGGFFVAGLSAPGIMYSASGAAGMWAFKTHSGLYTGRTANYTYDGTYYWGNAIDQPDQTRTMDLAADPDLGGADAREFRSLAFGNGVTVFVQENDQAAPVLKGVYTTTGSLALTTQTPPPAQDGVSYDWVAFNASSSPEPVTTEAFGLWQHEIGVDEIDGANVNAIYSFYQTGNLSLVSGGANRNIHIEMMEPDFVQTGTMTVKVVGRQNARAAEAVSAAFPFDETTELVHPKQTRRYLQLLFESNEAGADYLMGTPVIHVGDSGGRSSS